MSTTPNGTVFSFVHDDNAKCIAAYKKLTATYGQSDTKTADVIVAIGGDGFMLQALNTYAAKGKRVFGMNRGTVGFLLNDYRVTGLPDRIDQAIPIKLRRLKLTAQTIYGKSHVASAINEVALFRQSAQSANIKVTVDDIERLPKLVCDGVLVATPAGSTAYNLSAQGPIIPLMANLIALTPIAAFRPRRWPGALLPRESAVCFDVLNPEKRPVSATADGHEIRDVLIVQIETDRRISLTALFDSGQPLQERMLVEQFTTV